VLHVVNGDGTASVLAGAGLPGDVLVWRDILVEGPVALSPGPPADARARWLEARLHIEAAAYARQARAQWDGLRGGQAHDEVVLWFEQDLFCAVNLWAILAWLAEHGAPPHLSLIYPSLDEVPGLGTVDAARLGALFPERVSLAPEALAAGRLAWAAYASADPAGPPLSAGALPFVADAFRCHHGRFPSVANGLSEVEQAVLGALAEAPRHFDALFRGLQAQPGIRRHGMGDVQLAARVRDLGPLVAVDGPTVTRARLSPTRLGLDVLEGRRDALEVRPLDDWLGGVRLTADRPGWRWDGACQRLVRA
jgi:hypothetical protein